MKSIKKNLYFISILSIFISGCSIFQITEDYSVNDISEIYTSKYVGKEFRYSLYPFANIDSVKIDSVNTFVRIHLDKKFSAIPFRQDNVDSIYNETRRFFNNYFDSTQVEITSLGVDIKELIPNIYRPSESNIDSLRLPPVEEIIEPITFNKSKNFKPVNGLYNRNIALWHSHGWYYNHRLDRWMWQRARLFQTVEDIGPISFTLPFILPMLENAGANVFLPRERDIQLNEVIIDNNDDNFHLTGKWTIDTSSGFRMSGKSIPANLNPFRQGTHLYISTDPNSDASAEYIPSIPQTGEYSVYISYQSKEKSSPNVIYSVFHSGGETQFEVNQSIGGNTWIHLGKFKFHEGINPSKGKVIVSTSNSAKGEIVSTDAVRFGGGYGVVERNGAVSGKPKFIEGARYFMQYLGMPDSLVYNINENNNDYKDDYQGRGEWVNYLKGAPSGPNLNRETQGLGIPIDASIAFHTDAGVSRSDTTIGTLMIYSIPGMDSTTQYPEGYSRFANRDFADIMQTEIVDDIKAKYDPVWNRRSLRDAQYSECTRPNIPSVLLELASHQNFLDARFMADPRFKFDVSRSIYKSVLKFLSGQYNFDYVVQPLPVTHFSIERTGAKSIRLKWEGQKDPLEVTAIPKYYNIYRSTDSSGFDNGIQVSDNYLDIFDLEFDKIYNFKVTALNDGGESFPSEVLSCSFKDNTKPLVLVVNGFDRVSPPAHIETDKFSGFLNILDQGVPFHYDLGFTGEQHNFSTYSVWGTDDIPGHGASYADYETKIIAGNTFDYPYVHGKALTANGYSFISSSDESIESGILNLNDYEVVDIIMGEEKTTSWTKSFTDSLIGTQFHVFSPELVMSLQDYLNNKGKLFISGSYIGSDVFLNARSDDSLKTFVKDKLKYKLAADHAVKNGHLRSRSNDFMPADFDFSIITEINGDFYNAEAPDALTPTKEGEILLRYQENYFSAATGYYGDYGIVAFGFPFETIKSDSARVKVMNAVMNYLNRDE